MEDIKQQTKPDIQCDDNIGRTFSVVVDPDSLQTLSVVPNNHPPTDQPNLVNLSNIDKSLSYHKVTKTISDKLSVQDMLKVRQDNPHGFSFKIGEFGGITGNSANVPYS